MNNSAVTTKISAAFLATVLVAGIIALSPPSFMVGAQAAPGYGMDSYEKKSYGSEPEYGNDSYEKKSYGSEPEYGNDSYEKKSYGSEPESGMDSYEKRSYGSDDYESKYASYGKDHREKSKDSVSIKK